jgi:hypothetical protein
MKICSWTAGQLYEGLEDACSLVVPYLDTPVIKPRATSQILPPWGSDLGTEGSMTLVLPMKSYHEICH